MSRRPTMREVADQALAKVKESQALCHDLMALVERKNSAMQGVLDRLSTFLKWAQDYGWDEQDPFQRRTLDLVRELQDESLKGFVEDKKGPAP